MHVYRMILAVKVTCTRDKFELSHVYRMILAVKVTCTHDKFELSHVYRLILAVKVTCTHDKIELSHVCSEWIIVDNSSYFIKNSRKQFKWLHANQK